MTHTPILKLHQANLMHSHVTSSLAIELAIVAIHEQVEPVHNARNVTKTTKLDLLTHAERNEPAACVPNTMTYLRQIFCQDRVKGLILKVDVELCSEVSE